MEDKKTRRWKMSMKKWRRRKRSMNKKRRKKRKKRRRRVGEETEQLRSLYQERSFTFFFSCVCSSISRRDPSTSEGKSFLDRSS